MDITNYILEREMPTAEKWQLARKRDMNLYLDANENIGEKMLKALPNKLRDKKVLTARANGDTLEEIGRSLDLTRERVRAIEDAASKNAFQVFLADVRYIESFDDDARSKQEEVSKMLSSANLTKIAEKVTLPYQTLFNIKSGSYGKGETKLTGMYLYIICKAMDKPMGEILGKTFQLPSDVI